MPTCENCGGDLKFVTKDHVRGKAKFKCAECKIEFTFRRTRKRGIVRGEKWEPETATSTD